MEVNIKLRAIASEKVIHEVTVPQGKDSTAKFLGKVVKEGENLTKWFEKNPDYKREKETEVQIENSGKVLLVKQGTPVWAFFLTKMKGKTILRELIVNHPLDGKKIILCVSMESISTGDMVIFEVVFQILIQGKPVVTDEEKKTEKPVPQSQVKILHGETKPITTQELECPYCHNCMKITVNDVVIPAQHQKQIIVSETTQKIPFNTSKKEEKKPSESDTKKEQICLKCGNKYPECGYAWDTDSTGQQTCTGLKAKKPEKTSKKSKKGAK